MKKHCDFCHRKASYRYMPTDAALWERGRDVGFCAVHTLFFYLSLSTAWRA